MKRRGFWLGSLAAWLLGGALVARWFTFDPEAQARALWAQVHPFSASDVGNLRRIAHASSLADTAAGVDDIDPAALAERVRVAQESSGAMRERFHHGPGPCPRYFGEVSFDGAASGPKPRPPAEASGPDRPVDPGEAARAMVAAGFAPQLDQLIRVCATRQAQRDDGLHEADEAAEVVTFFSEKADPWTRLGLRLRREATLAAARRLVSPRPASSLPDERVREALALCERYGSPVPAAMLVAKWKLRVDLTAAESHLIHPGMSWAEVRARLGDPAAEGSEWVYTSPSTRVRFDPGGWVASVVSPLPKWAPTLFVGDEPLVHTDRDSVVAALGEPAWKGDGERRAASDSDEILGYDRPPYAMELYFLGGKLESVELRNAR